MKRGSGVFAHNPALFFIAFCWRCSERLAGDNLACKKVAAAGEISEGLALNWDIQQLCEAQLRVHGFTMRGRNKAVVSLYYSINMHSWVSAGP